MTTTSEQVQRESRAARNQSLFRDVNERIEEMSLTTTLVEFVCECANVECTERMPLRLGEYGSVRQDGTRFAVLPGHVLPDVERVVERHDRYEVVEKARHAGETAAELDPRAPAGAS